MIPSIRSILLEEMKVKLPLEKIYLAPLEHLDEAISLIVSDDREELQKLGVQIPDVNTLITDDMECYYKDFVADVSKLLIKNMDHCPLLKEAFKKNDPNKFVRRRYERRKANNPEAITLGRKKDIDPPRVFLGSRD